MTRTSSVIEINGNRYDAGTGQFLGAVKKGASHLKNSAHGVIDGFNRQSTSTTHRKLPSTHKIPTSRTVKQAAQNVHRTAQRSRTLMRGAVTKPVKKSSDMAEKAHTYSKDSKHNDFFRARKTVDSKTVGKHAHVKRFGHLSSAKNQPLGPAKTGEIVNQHAASQPTSSSTVVAKPLPSMTSSASHQHLERLLDRALTTANAHEQLLASSRRGHRFFHRIRKMPKLSIVAGLFILASTLTFFAWHNVPQVAVKVAAARANVNASVPSYVPDGFSFASPISYSPGEVKLKFKDNNNKAYELTQQKSNWSSSSLATSVLSANTQVQTSQVNGTTVYIYGHGNDATWVNRGVRYILTDKANLSSDQILKIAQSL